MSQTVTGADLSCGLTHQYWLKHPVVKPHASDRDISQGTTPMFHTRHSPRKLFPLNVQYISAATTDAIMSRRIYIFDQHLHYASSSFCFFSLRRNLFSRRLVKKGALSSRQNFWSSVACQEKRFRDSDDESRGRDEKKKKEPMHWYTPD